MEETFFFALLRISVAQMLKAAGFDKCKPSVLNIITELYLKHLELVVSKTKKFAVSRTNAVNDIEACDVAEALLDIGFLKPSSGNGHHETKNTKSVDSFKNWVQYSDSHAVSRRLSAVPTSLLANLIEKRKIDTSAETDQERKKRRLRERQEYFNQLKQGDDKPDRASDLAMDIDEDELTASDKLSWLAYLAEKDMKLGQNMKFINTCIQDDLMHVHKLKKYHPTVAEGEDSFVSFKHQIHTSNKNDHFLLQLQEDDKTNEGKSQQQVLPSADLKSILPYNVKYDEYLVDDDLQQYLQYASTHEDEINERLEALNKPVTDTEVNANDAEKDAEKDPENNDEEKSIPSQPKDAEVTEKEASPTEDDGKKSETVIESKTKDNSQNSLNDNDASAENLESEKIIEEEKVQSPANVTTEVESSVEKEHKPREEEEDKNRKNEEAQKEAGKEVKKEATSPLQKKVKAETETETETETTAHE